MAAGRSAVKSRTVAGSQWYRRAMGVASQAGTRPPCSGRAATLEKGRILTRIIHEREQSSSRLRFENRPPQAGKAQLRLNVRGRGVGAPIPTPCRKPALHFSCDRVGLLRRFSPRTRLLDAERVNNPG
jgi:hypothetical protein